MSAQPHQFGLYGDVDQVADAAQALGQTIYEPIELCAPPIAEGEDAREVFEHIRTVELRLIAQLIAAGPQATPLSVRQLMKLARAAGLKRDSGYPHHPEIIPLLDGWPDGPITVVVDAYVTPARRIAVLKVKPNTGERSRVPASKPGSVLVSRLLAWPTRDAAAELLATCAPANQRAPR